MHLAPKGRDVLDPSSKKPLVEYILILLEDDRKHQVWQQNLDLENVVNLF